jgi:hypothetical protein
MAPKEGKRIKGYRVLAMRKPTSPRLTPGLMSQLPSALDTVGRRFQGLWDSFGLYWNSLSTSHGTISIRFRSCHTVQVRWGPFVPLLGFYCLSFPNTKRRCRYCCFLNIYNLPCFCVPPSLHIPVHSVPIVWFSIFSFRSERSLFKKLFINSAS